MQFNAWSILQIQIPCCVLWYRFHVHKWYGSGDTVTQNYQCVQSHETWFTSRTHSSNCDGNVSPYLNMFLYTSIFAVSNSTSFVSVDGRIQEIQSRKFTHVHQNHENGLFHRLTAPYLMEMSQYVLHTVINFNLCCIQRFRSHVHRW